VPSEITQALGQLGAVIPKADPPPPRSEP